MQVTVESTGTLGKRMRVALPAERLEQEFEHRLKVLSKKVKLPGFRPGKVPLKVVEAQYGREVLQEVTTDLIRSSFYEAVGKEGLKPAGGPNIAPRPSVRGKDLEYTAEFEVYPEVRKLDLSGVVIERPLCDIVDEDIDRTLEIMRRQRITWKDVDREARLEDRLVVDFVGNIDGIPFEGGQAKEFSLVLGEGRLVPGFEDGLVGAKAGGHRTVAVRFPESYPTVQIAGRDAKFEVEIKQVQEPVAPPLDADFIRTLGIESGNLEQLRNEVVQGLRKEADQRVRGVVKERVFKALLDANSGDLPAILVEQEAAHLMEVARANLKEQGVPMERIPNDLSAFRDRARSRVALGIILSEIIKRKAMRVDPAKVRARVDELATSYETPDEVVQWHYARPERLAEIESAILEEQVVALLLESAEISEQRVAFRDLPTA